jgi:hypothetical protein
MILDQPDDDYRAEVGINSSSLHHALRSAGHYRYAKDHPKPGTDAMVLGQAVHILLLTPELESQRIAVLPDDAPNRRSNAGKQWHEDWQRRTEGKFILEPARMQLARDVADRVRSHGIAGPLLDDCAYREVSFYWTELATGLPCKSRLDGLSRDYRLIVDLKTTADAREDAFARSAWDYRYDLQAAHYVDGVLAVKNIQPLYCWIAVETEPPFGVGVYSAAPQLLNIGDEDRDHAMRLINECSRTGQWPLYAETVRPLNLPHWAIRARLPR